MFEVLMRQYLTDFLIKSRLIYLKTVAHMLWTVAAVEEALAAAVTDDDNDNHEVDNLALFVIHE